LNYTTYTPGTIEFGRAFEHFIFQECCAYSHYSRKDFPIHFWRSASGSEVDLILGDAEVAIEIKSSEVATGKTKGIHLFAEEYKTKNCFIVSRDLVPRKISSIISILPWQNFCEMLWQGEII
jgi:predicted AAA+ superfamily ATPase